jgi:hypothetical protein
MAESPDNNNREKLAKMKVKFYRVLEQVPLEANSAVMIAKYEK